MAKNAASRTRPAEGGIDIMAPKQLSREQFGKKLHQLLTDRRWNQSDLARAAGIGRDAVSTYIRGRNFPEPKNLAKMAAALDMTMDELLPNISESAIEQETPAFEMKISHGDPTTAWLRINQKVSISLAAKIIELLQAENEASNR